MTAEKQTASEIRSQGALQWGAAGYAQLALFAVKRYEELDSWRRVSLVWILFLEEIAAATTFDNLPNQDNSFAPIELILLIIRDCPPGILPLWWEGGWEWA